jgi:Lrp/AsnC family transcriptional regulator
MPAATAQELDEIDTQILQMMQKDGSLTYHEIGEKVDLSVTAVNYRIKKLHLQGVLLKTVALVDAESVGLNALAFVLLKIADYEKEKKVVAALLKRPEIQECHRVAGGYSYLLKVRGRNIQDIETFVDRHARPAIGAGEATILLALSTQKQTTELPL